MSAKKLDENLQKLLVKLDDKIFDLKHLLMEMESGDFCETDECDRDKELLIHIAKSLKSEITHLKGHLKDIYVSDKT